MKNYLVQKLNLPIELNSDWNRNPWKGIEPLHLQEYMGDEPKHKPKTQAKVAYDKEAMYVIFMVEDRYVEMHQKAISGGGLQGQCCGIFF